MKKLFILGSIITLIGLVITMISAFFGGFEDIGNMNSDYEERVRVDYVFEGDYNEIIVVDKNIPIYIGQSEDNKIYVSTYESSEYFYDIVNNDRLEIKYNDKASKVSKLINFDFFEYEDYYTEIKLPLNISCNIDISNSNGSIDIENIILDKNIDIKTTNGRIDINEVKLESLETKTTNGSIKLHSVEVGNLTAETSNGGIDTDNIITYGDLSLKTSNGRITGSDIQVQSDIYVKTSNGSVNINKLYYQEDAEIKTTNGRIYLELGGKLEDYKINAETSLGKIFINDDNKHREFDKKFIEGRGEKYLNVKSSNSNIDIVFIE